MRNLKRVICVVALFGLLCIPHTSLAARTKIGFLTFETGIDSDIIGTSIPGIVFISSTADWYYGDVRTHQYNAPYPQRCTDRPPLVRTPVCAYRVSGNIFARINSTGNMGQFAFTQGLATFVEAHIATGDGLTAIAYNEQAHPIASQFIPGNAGTGKFGLLRLVAPTGQRIASVSLGGTANFWLLDDLMTDAPGVPDQRINGRDSAFVTVTVYPSIEKTEADRMLVYTLVATNRGQARANETIITLPFDSQEVVIVGATTSRPTAWVSRVVSESLELRTGPLERSDTITTTLQFALLPGATDFTRAIGRASFSWSDKAGGGTSRSNTPAPDRIDRLGYYRLDVAVLQALPTESRRFMAEIFVPNEPISIWYNQPDSSVVAVEPQLADENGIIQLDLSFARHALGYYSMVLYGRWSKFTAVGSFQIE